MAKLTSRVLAQSTAITPTTLIHIVTTGDTSQDISGSSYKAELQQLASIFSGSSTFSGGSGNCITDFYVTNIHGCSPITVYDSIKSTGSTVSGLTSFSFGYQTSATTNYSHAEGYRTISSGQYSHAEGYTNLALGIASHAEGGVTYNVETGVVSRPTSATTYSSHSEGAGTLASGQFSHAEGYYTMATEDSSHSEGYYTEANGDSSHAEGYFSVSNGLRSHAEGHSTIADGDYSHTEGIATNTIGYYSHAEGNQTIATGMASHSEGSNTNAIGDYSHSEGTLTIASNYYSHAEGDSTVASGEYSHSEGYGTQAIGNGSHAEGGYYSHPVYLSGGTAIGNSSHAEGIKTVAYGNYSHAEGNETYAFGSGSHTEGYGTYASGDYQHVIGKWNLTADTTSGAFIIGNGNSDINRSNLLFAANSVVTINGTMSATTISGGSVYINTVGSGTPLINLGLDVAGRVVTGTTGSSSVDPYYNSGSGSTITWNVSGQSTNYIATLTAATTTLNLTGVTNGHYGTIILTQDGTGGRTISLGTINGSSVTHKVANGGGGSVTLTATPYADDILTFTYNGSKMFWTISNDYT